MAQQKENRDTDGSILRGPYETNSFWSNWYIGVGGGINIYEGEFDNKTSVGNRIAPALDVSLGKWITPSYGVRLQYSGLKAKGLTDASGMYAKGAHRGYYKEEFNAVSYTHLDVYKRQVSPQCVFFYWTGNRLVVGAQWSYVRCLEGWKTRTGLSLSYTNRTKKVTRGGSIRCVKE